MLEPGSEKEVVREPFFDDTIKKRIDDMSSYMEAALVEKLRVAGKFAFQVDEATDIGNFAPFIYSHCALC